MQHASAHQIVDVVHTEGNSIPLWDALVYGSCFVLAILCWRTGFWPITVLSWLPLAYFSHTIMTALHEAAHGNLRPRKWDNELRGKVIGYLTLVPLSAYRAVHMTHHRYLAEPRDGELWPYTDPQRPRWFRVLFAWGEIIAGLVVTPLLFVRGVVASKSIPKVQRRKILKDYLVTIAIWTAIMTAVAVGGDWIGFVMCFLIPAILAASLQTLRKFTEHLGMLDNTPEGASRTIVDPSPIGQFVSTTMLHIAYHAIHHRHAAIPYYELPRAGTEAIAKHPEENQVFPSYWQAFLDMAPSLADPKVGGQWLETNKVAHQTMEDVPLPVSAGR